MSDRYYRFYDLDHRGAIVGATNRAFADDAEALERAAQASERIHRAIDDYCSWKMSYIIRNGACNARHSVEQRLCRWLLTCSDVLERRQIDLRQDIFAKMLGVQRSSVNPILQRLQADGLIEIGRGRLIIQQRPALTERACECYPAMRLPQDGTWAVPHAQAVRAAS